MRIFLPSIVIFFCATAAFADWPATGNTEVDSLLSGAKGAPLKIGLPMYARALRIKPNCASIFIERAMSYERGGDLVKARSDCDRALKLEPENAFNYLVSADIFFLGAQYKDAHDAADKARVLETDAYQLDNNALRIEGASNYYLGDYKNAIEFLTAGLNNVPTGSHGSADAYYYRGLSYLKWDDPYKALADFNEALKIYPKCSKYYLARAEAHKMLNKEQLAKRDLQTARKLPPEKHLMFY